VKRSGRDEPVWVVISMCMEATLGISLYSYLYLKQKHYVFLIISYGFSSTKSENKKVEQVLPRSGVRVDWRRGGVGRRWSKQCIHMYLSKCKNDTIKLKKIKYKNKLEKK
jgi:hypothetical protein